MNGLGLDDWLEQAIGSASATGTPLVRLGVDLPGVQLLPGETVATQNPHLWMDVKYAEGYVDRDRAGPRSVDPADSGALRQPRRGLPPTARSARRPDPRRPSASLPEASRRVVTYHDAFPYYARAYGLTVVGVAVEAPGQEPSAQYAVQLIQAIRDNSVKAIFSENQFPTQLVDTLAQETGMQSSRDLYDDSLSDECLELRRADALGYGPDRGGASVNETSPADGPRGRACAT